MVLILHGFVGILHQIEEGLLAQAFVERNERQSAGVVALDAHRLGLLLFRIEAIGNRLQNTIEKGGQVRGMRFGVYYSSGLDWTFGGTPIRSLADLVAAIPRTRTYAAYADAQWRELTPSSRQALLLSISQYRVA